MVFKNFWVLLLIPVVLGLAAWVRQRQSPPGICFPSRHLLEGVPQTWRVRFREVPYILRLSAVVLFILALAGPRSVLEEAAHQTEGIDIILAIDSSGSMAAEDFTIGGQRYNRLDIVKGVVRDFIKERKNDRIGLVTFAGLAYTVCPLTTDYDWLTANLNRIDLGLIKDGTAVGSAIASSLSRLKDSSAKSRIVILLTDGMNNAGEIDPLTAARAAQTFGIKIYTIGAGTKGLVPFPAVDVFGRKVYQRVKIDLDEETLRKIADITGGKYYFAADTESLRQIYAQIDALEKSEIQEVGYRQFRELFPIVLSAALIILLAEVLLSNTLFLQVP